MNLWWLSFVDPDEPAGSRFLGVAIVPGEDFIDAVDMATAWGCNPGGEIAGKQIDFTTVTKADVGRLLSKQEALALNARAAS